MSKPICSVCKEEVQFDVENSYKIIRYDNKFHHYDCFLNLCSKKKQSRHKGCAQRWAEAEKQIDQLIADTAKRQRDSVFRDKMYWWFVEKYNLSSVTDYFFTKLASIYDGTYTGLAYPISGEELFEEWQYYFDELNEISKNKDMRGEPLMIYHLGILLSRNAEYRDIKKKECLAKEIQKQQQDEVKVNQDTMFVSSRNARQRKNKTADLYKEMVGDENNG